MDCFTLKSILADGTSLPFTLYDLPVPIDNRNYILMNRINTPILDLNNIRRGDPESGLYEGDVIQHAGEMWLVCYERGFYVINHAYVIKHFSDLDDYEYIGIRENLKIDIPIKTKRTHMFRYKTTMFHLRDIRAAVDGKLILSMFHDPVVIDEVHQECSFTYNGHKVFLGDEIDGDKIHLQDGRLMANGRDLAVKEAH